MGRAAGGPGGPGALRPETAELCDRAAYACRTAAQGSVLLSLTVNLIQLALFDLLVQSNFSVSLDLLPLALAGAMFLLSR